MEKKMNFGMNAAEFYEAPVCEVLELQTEGVLCDSWTDEEGDITRRMLDDYEEEQ